MTRRGACRSKPQTNPLILLNTYFRPKVGPWLGTRGAALGLASTTPHEALATGQWGAAKNSFLQKCVKDATGAK